MTPKNSNEPDPKESKEIDLLYRSWGHDLRNKTILINNFVTLIRRALQEQSIDVHRINSWLDTMEKTLGEISSIPSPFHIEQVQLNSFIEKRINQIQDFEIYKGIQFHLTLDSKQPVIFANSVWLRRFFDILLENAAVSMSKSSIKQIQINTQVRDRIVSIQVNDTGQGIDEKFISSLFLKPLKTGQDGRGRGLYIANLIADTYGGKISLVNTSRTGTSLEIQLPLDDIRDSNKRNESTNEKQATILVADNEQSFRNLWAELLSQEGYQVRTAGNPTDAQRMLEQGGIDLAVLDLRLSDDDEEQDVSGLKVAEVAPSIPKIILTAYSNVEVVRKTFEKHLAVDFVSKIEGVDKVLTTIKRSLSIDIQLEKDFEEARKQATFTHRTRLVLIIVGAIVIIGGAIGVLAGQITSGLLSIVSGVVVEALAGLFSKLSDDASKRMDRYHKELLSLYKKRK